MNRALAYGLMGAASGVLGGVYNEWQQNQQDIHNAALLRAKMLEEQQLARMKAQYDSASNLEKIQAQLQADMQQDAANNQAKAAIESQKEAADASLQTAKDKAAMNRAQVGAGATIQAANIRAAADNGDPKPKLVAVKDKSGNITFQTAAPGGSLPAGSSLTNLNGDPDFSQLPIGMLGNFGAPSSMAQSDNANAASSSTPTVPNPGAPVTKPGSSVLNPVDASSLDSAPPLGTWVKLPDGSVKQYRGPGA